MSNRIPFVIDNDLWHVLKSILKQNEGKALDIATRYFDLGGWDALADNILKMSSSRLLLGVEPEAGSDLGLREWRARLGRGPAPYFNEHVRQLTAKTIAFLSEERVQVRLHTKGVLNAKYYLVYSGNFFEHYSPIVAIVGSSDFTYDGLFSSNELNLACRPNLLAEEVVRERWRGCGMGQEELATLARLSSEERVIAANVPGEMAINDLATSYEHRWEASRDFKKELIKLFQDVPFIVES